MDSEGQHTNKADDDESGSSNALTEQRVLPNEDGDFSMSDVEARLAETIALEQERVAEENLPPVHCDIIPDTSNYLDDETDGLDTATSLEAAESKRRVIKKLIEQYFYQLLEGCGSPTCNNRYCKSSGQIGHLTANQAAARAIHLFASEAMLCKKPEIKEKPQPSISKPSTSQARIEAELFEALHVKVADKMQQMIREYTSVNVETLVDVIELSCVQNNKRALVHFVGKFSSPEFLIGCFEKKPMKSIEAILVKAPCENLEKLKKEDIRTMEGDMDKDADSSSETSDKDELHYSKVDFILLRQSLIRLQKCCFSIEGMETLITALHTLSINVSVDSQIMTRDSQIEEVLSVCTVVFEIAACCNLTEQFLPKICQAAGQLPVAAQARLAHIWSKNCTSTMQQLLQTLQSLISLQVLQHTNANPKALHSDEVILAATKVMKILYYANILAGENVQIKAADEDDNAEGASAEDSLDDAFFGYQSSRRHQSLTPVDPLAVKLEANVLNCRIPFIPFEDFYNELLSDTIEMANDYYNYKKCGSEFSFMNCSFILTPATKTLALYYDSRIRMYSERNFSLWRNHISGQSPNPYLRLNVRRDQLIDDALVELEMVAMSHPKDLKKQLVVEFVGEQGVDEGGVSKEFFQLIVEEIFNPDYGMFVQQTDLETVWFNSTSFENEAQFTLIGIVIGLAIYNNIILNVNFPMVVYRKLLGIKGNFVDLDDWNPVLFKSLTSMIDYEDNDMEEVFMQTFQISYSDVFGNVLQHDLKPNGESEFVNQSNKYEFADLYSDFLLNKNISKQFKAFQRGFQMVTDESPLLLLFRPEEIELLVCGSQQFDFNELEKATEYENGYNGTSQIILDFWSIVHALSMESKKKLLEFTTGSDRVPVGGLSRLKLIIARNGPDSDRLPTSHTCFNVLLLPEYSTKEKLEDRLIKAINYSKGFGML